MQEPERVADHTAADRCQYCGQPVEPWQARECEACFKQANQFPADELGFSETGFWNSGAELARFQYESALGYSPNPDYCLDDEGDEGDD